MNLGSLQLYIGVIFVCVLFQRDEVAKQPLLSCYLGANIGYKLCLTLDTQSDGIKRASKIPRKRIIAWGHYGKGRRLSRRGDEDFRKVRPTKSDRGGLFGRSINPAFNGSVGIISDNAAAVPLCRPDKS